MFFFFNDTATTEIYTLSLHDALPIWRAARMRGAQAVGAPEVGGGARAGAGPTGRPGDGPRAHRRRRRGPAAARDRKSTRLNSSHANISYAVFCLKKKKK